ncbi:MAG: hypothetical protein U0359_29865 [Byssovorax sp.]
MPTRSRSPFAFALRLARPASLVAALGAIAVACGGGNSTTGSSTGQGGSSGTNSTTSTGTAGGSSGTAGGSGTGGDVTGCKGNADCAASATKPICDTSTGQCVECLPSDDPCPMGKVCSPDTHTCGVGCSDVNDCMPGQQCDTTTHQCTGCVVDTDCPLGSVCFEKKSCIPGCSATQGCDGAKTCCSQSFCADVENDPQHCGDCNSPCPAAANATAGCSAGKCTYTCDGAFADCNGDVADGCEHNTLQDGPCLCAPGDMKPCYDGGPGTENKGPCHAGTKICNADGLSFGACMGEVVPEVEICNNGIDEDCTGVADDVQDFDGDGWTKCQGDCCDSAVLCNNPELVNPGAFDVAGNNLDDDCDGMIDNGVLTCDTGLASNSATPLDYAKAIDLCNQTTESPPLPAKKWGVISANLFLANGAGSPAAASRSIRPGFGVNVTPKKGQRMAVISTGHAAAQAIPNNLSPNYADFQGGQDMGTSSGVPADYLAAHNNVLPNAPGCPDPQGGNTAHDSVMLKVRVRVPTNAKSFNVSTFFYSSEYPEWVCSAFNDFFLTLLDSSFVPAAGQSPNPADKNLAFYDPPPAGGPVYPVGVNLAFGNTGLFSQCKNGPTGCGSGAVAGNTNSCAATTQLTGTGFDIANPGSQFPGDPGWCGNSNFAGGGTGWLTTAGNVKPGETIELRFVIWDTGDGWYDSVSLIDNFTWSLTAATPGTHN